MSGIDGTNAAYDELYQRKKKTIDNLCALYARSTGLDAGRLRVLKTKIEKYNAANRSIPGGTEPLFNSYELHHPGDLVAYYTTPVLESMYKNSAYYKALPWTELTKNKLSDIPLSMLKILILWLVPIFVTYALAPSAFLPVIFAGCAYFMFAILGALCTDTDFCLHPSPIYTPEKLSQLMGTNTTKSPLVQQSLHSHNSLAVALPSGTGVADAMCRIL